MIRSAAIALAFVLLGGSSSDAASHVTMDELLRILNVQVWRIRVPTDPDFVWDIQLLSKAELKPTGTIPHGLTRGGAMLAFRDLGTDKVEFTLPDLRGFSRGVFELCQAGVACQGQFTVHWNQTPKYAVDGDQCVIGEITNETEKAPSRFVALVKTRSRP